MIEAKAVSFPKDFIWSSGNSAIQCEGGNVDSDWYYFEKDNFVKSGEKIGLAVDHYNRYEEDFSLAKKLSQNGHRMTIEWSRIEKNRGEYDSKEIEHYRKVLNSLKKNGLKSIVTLHHFSNPTWFTIQGGWEKRENIKYFTAFTELIASELGDLIDFWVVINEPNTYIGLGYVIGEIPPLKHNPIKAYKVLNNMAHAHNLAYDIIHKNLPQAMVGCANNCQLLTSKSGNTTGPISTLSNYISNYYYIEKTKDKIDYIGLNYYFPTRIFKKYCPARTDMGWEIYPKGLYDSTMALWKRYRKPIFVLENGLADNKDTLREDYIKSHLNEFHRAMLDGAKIIGYTYWSLSDNFELAKGFGPKFGLISVDPKTLNRTIKKSALAYKKICESNGLY